MTRIALLSVHTCPLAALGGKETGGMNVYVRELARELGRLGVAVDVFTRSQNRAVPQVVPLGENARVVHIEAGPPAPIPKGEAHAHLGAFVEGVEVFRRAEGLRYDLLHSHYWLSGVAALELREAWGAPVVHMFHTLAELKNAAARHPDDLEPPIRLAEERRVALGADRLVAANPVERAHLRWYYGAAADRIAVIPCGVDLELFSPRDGRQARARLGLGADRVLLYVGRLAPIKGVETLLRALSFLKADGFGATALRLLVVGGGIEERWEPDGEASRLRALARGLGVEAWVEFRGAQPQDVLPDYYAAADLCLMPSLYESFGMVALEAMACGVPVVGSRVGGLAVTIREGVTGALVPEGDPDQLGRRIGALLRDEPCRRALGRQAVQWARRFRWPCIAEQVAELYEELLPALREAPRLRSRC